MIQEKTKPKVGDHREQVAETCLRCEGTGYISYYKIVDGERVDSIPERCRSCSGLGVKWQTITPTSSTGQ